MRYTSTHAAILSVVWPSTSLLPFFFHFLPIFISVPFSLPPPFSPIVVESWWQRDDYSRWQVSSHPGVCVQLWWPVICFCQHQYCQGNNYSKHVHVFCVHVRTVNLYIQLSFDAKLNDHKTFFCNMLQQPMNRVNGSPHVVIAVLTIAQRCALLSEWHLHWMHLYFECTCIYYKPSLCIIITNGTVLCITGKHLKGIVYLLHITIQCVTMEYSHSLTLSFSLPPSPPVPFPPPHAGMVCIFWCLYQLLRPSWCQFSGYLL